MIEYLPFRKSQIESIQFKSKGSFVHVIVTMRLNVKAVDKLRPLLESDQVDKVTLVLAKLSTSIRIKLAQVTYGSSASFQSNGGHISPFPEYVVTAGRTLTVILGYLTPYGVIAWIAARLTGSRSMISLIGGDFNKRLKMGRWVCSTTAAESESLWCRGCGKKFD